MEPAGYRRRPGGPYRPTAVGAPASPSLRVLVCDDERHLVRLIQVNLERQGHTVMTAFDGKECLEQIDAEMPDLLILDVMMPYMDGFEVLKKLRSNPLYEYLPVIMLTAKAEDRDFFEGYHYGADMYITKPFNPIDLMSILRR